jgi:PncC family amidohydrolase
MIEKVLDTLIDYEYKIAFAESMTGGALASALIRYPNASSVLSYSVVTYSKEAKSKFLDIKPMLFDVHGVVSKVISIEMAEHIKDIAQSDIGVGITGNAGPTAQGDTEIGEVWFSIAYKNETYSYHIKLKETSRAQVIDDAVKVVYQMLYKLLTQ